MNGEGRMKLLNRAALAARALWPPLVLPLLLLALWLYLSGGELAPAYLLPSPGRVGQSLYDYAFGQGRAFQGRLSGDLAASLARVCCGFSLAAACGLPLGLVSGRSGLAARLLSPLINSLRAVPGICWLPLCLVWLGIGFKTTLFLIALAAFFPIYFNTLTGVLAVPELLLRSGRMLGLSGRRILTGVIIPAAMPQIRAGLRLGLGLSFAYLVLGELTGVPNGVGAMIMDARAAGRVDMVICGILVLAATGWLADLILRGLTWISFKSIRHQ